MNPRAPLLLILAALPGCDALWQGLGVPASDAPCASDYACLGEGYLSADLPTQPQVDILFVLRNALRAVPAQYQLAQGSGAFFDRLDSLGLDAHIGVVSSDVGNQPDGGPFTVLAAPPPYLGNVHCQSSAGDDGALQTAPCTQRALGLEGAPLCQAVCDGQVTLAPGGAYLTRGAALRGSFRCLALLGDQGCNVEGPLDASLRAVEREARGPLSSATFLRERSVLALLYQSEEDDCSQGSAQRAFNDPGSRDCPSQPATFGDYLRCFNADYRCFVRAVECGGDALLASGVKVGCGARAAATDTLTSVSAYAQRLRALRGDERLYVAGLWAPPLAQSDSSFVATLQVAGKVQSDVQNRAPTCELRPAAGQTFPAVPAYPQVRLSAFAAQFKHHRELTLCQQESFGARLAEVATSVGALAVTCLPGLVKTKTEPADASAGAPVACIVGDLSAAELASSPGADLGASQHPPQQRLPQCPAACCQAVAAAAVPLPGEASLQAACPAAGAAATPCFCVTPSQHPEVCAGGAVVAVLGRPVAAAAAPAPLTRVACARSL